MDGVGPSNEFFDGGQLTEQVAPNAMENLAETRLMDDNTPSLTVEEESVPLMKRDNVDINTDTEKDNIKNNQESTVGSSTTNKQSVSPVSNEANTRDATKAEVKRDPNLVSVTLRPVDKGWVMGEEWVVDFSNLMTMSEIRIFVEQQRGISRHRIQLRLKGKVLPTNRETWTLRRMGIYDGYTIFVEPTLQGAWLWEPKEYYCNKLLDEVCEVIQSTVSVNGVGRINMKVLSEKIQPPPCIKTSLRVFLRQYPERVYIHTDTSDNDLWVHITKRPFQLPTFGNFSVEIGTFQYYRPKRFDWEGNKDIDDMYKIETLPVAEEETAVEEGKEGVAESLEIAVLSPEEAAHQAVLANEQSARQAALNDNDSYADDQSLIPNTE